jgi:type IV conjugative transfer system protein TraL
MSGIDTSINSHVILSHIDAPARILFWPAHQFFTCAIPFGVGMATDHLVAGLIVAFLCICFFQKFDTRFGNGRFRSIVYWYLPTSSKIVKLGVPPSHVRYWVR